ACALTDYDHGWETWGQTGPMSGWRQVKAFCVKPEALSQGETCATLICRAAFREKLCSGLVAEHLKIHRPEVLRFHRRRWYRRRRAARSPHSPHPAYR